MKGIGTRAKEVFARMYREDAEYRRAKEARLAERKKLEEAGDWDGVEAWNWHEATDRGEEPPHGDGAMHAVRDFVESLRNGSTCFVCDHLPQSDTEWYGYIGTLRTAGVGAFAVTDQSPALLDGLFALAENGCRIEGVQEVVDSQTHRRRRGIIIAIPRQNRPLSRFFWDELR